MVYHFHHFSLPARGQEKVNCGRYPKVYATPKYETCLMRTKYNEHGVIYVLGVIEGDFLIYKGKSGDAILEEIPYCRVECPSKPKREYGSWRKTGQYYLFRFPRGKIYIPIP
ncbi:MAG: hypothetical protein O4753_04810 [Trichodesmium sp. St7_bin2_1]|nr:hypothetical protein [Trichodesmium sp. St7_bin2_1]